MALAQYFPDWLKDKNGNMTNYVRVRELGRLLCGSKAEFEVIFGEGISRVSEIFNLAVDMGIIKKSGSWFSYNESKLGQGAEAVKGIVRDNPELLEEITAKVTEKLAEKKD